MKSIYESIKDIMEMGSRGAATATDKDSGPLMKKLVPSLYNKDRKPLIDLGLNKSSKPAEAKPYKDTSGTEYDAAGNPARAAEKPQARTVVPEPKKAPVVRSEPKQAPNPNQSTVDASNKTNQAAVAKMKEIESGGSGEGKDRFSGQANTDKNTGGNALKATSAQPAEPKKDDSFKSAGPLPGTVGGGGALAPEVKPASEKPQASTVATPASHTVDTKDTEQFRTKTYTKPEKQEPDTTVRSGSGDAVTTGSGGNLKTDTPDEIAQRGPFGIKMNKPKKTNENFGVSDKLYTDVMEVLKKSNVQGSKPRNDREKELAKAYGDPNRITHGDVLKMRGVTKEETVDENKDTPGNSYEHQCAIHVKSESFGEGRTITTQHADPDENGNIAWYDVMFEHGIEKAVPTSELEILVSESHMHSKRKKKAM